MSAKFILLIVVVVIVFAMSSGKKKKGPKKRPSTDIDPEMAIMELMKQADNLNRELSTLVYDHGEDLTYEAKIVATFEAWLTLVEQYLAIPSDWQGEETAPHCYEISSVFYILVKNRNRSLISMFTKRLEAVRYYNVEDLVILAQETVEKEEKSEAEYAQWLRSVPAQIEDGEETGNTSQLLKIATRCIQNYEPSLAAAALEVAERTGKAEPVRLNVLLAGVCRIEERYDEAIMLLRDAYREAKSKGIKSRINSVEVEMRKVTKERGDINFPETASALLAAS